MAKRSKHWKDANYVFHDGPKPFNEVYPQIASLSIKVRQSGINVGKENLRTTTFSSAHPPDAYVGCANPACIDSDAEGGRGFYLQGELDSMIRQGKTEHSGQKMCAGYERMGRRDQRTCLTFFHFEIEVVYRQKDDASVRDSA